LQLITDQKKGEEKNGSAFGKEKRGGTQTEPARSGTGKRKQRPQIAIFPRWEKAGGRGRSSVSRLNGKEGRRRSPGGARCLCAGKKRAAVFGRLHGGVPEKSNRQNAVERRESRFGPIRRFEVRGGTDARRR